VSPKAIEERSSLPASSSITLRSATVTDEEFLLKIHASTRAAEMALVPWSEEQREAFLQMQFNAQHSHYLEQFPRADYKLILADGEPVGRLYVDRDDMAVKILDIAVLPDKRRAGIATFLLTEILAEAKESDIAVRIHVETFNPSLGLFERLGFNRIAEEGINFLLEWRPNK
jgi:ribosomal protein S18 acetylase RimI-like enzyme